MKTCDSTYHKAKCVAVSLRKEFFLTLLKNKSDSPKNKKREFVKNYSIVVQTKAVIILAWQGLFRKSSY